MTLSTTSELLISSPIAGETSFEVPGAAQLVDLSHHLGVLHLRGPQSEKALRRFGLDQPDPEALAIGAARSTEAGILCRLAADEFLLLVESPEAWGPTYARSTNLSEILSDEPLRATASDLTHGYGKLALSGPRAAELLPKLCGLDFSEAGFPDGHVAQTSLAKVHATLARMDEQGGPPKYYLLVDRSLSAYVWEVMKAVMKEFIVDRITMGLSD